MGPPDQASVDALRGLLCHGGIMASPTAAFGTSQTASRVRVGEGVLVEGRGRRAGCPGAGKSYVPDGLLLL